jgi:hypothetical protein
MLPRIGTVGGPGGYLLGRLPMRKARIIYREMPAITKKAERRNSMVNMGNLTLVVKSDNTER